MLTYNMDVAPESVWKRTTPSAAALEQPYYCTEAGLFYGRSDFATARTNKESWILFYTTRGEGRIEQEGTIIDLRPGQALLLDCRTAQSYGTAPGHSRWEHYWVHLDGAGVAAMERLIQPERRLVAVTVRGTEMRELFEQLLAGFGHDTVDGTVRMGLLLHEMLGLCAQGLLEEDAAMTSRQTILRSAETLRRNYQKDLQLADLLAQAHMSKSYFLRLFRRYMGTTPYNYLINYRITQAKELLVLTDQSVASIAHEVGFGDASNFSTRFTAATGQSPLRYRKSALQSAEAARQG